MSRQNWRAGTWRALMLAGVVCGSAAGLAACGDPSTAADGGVATIAPSAVVDGTTPTGSDSTVVAADPEAPTDPDAAFELFNKCMSEQGFDINAKAPGADDQPVVVQGGTGSGPEPGGGAVIMGPGGVQIDPEDAEKFQAANETCAVHLANVQDQFAMSPEQQAAMEDATLRIENCMKDKGFDVHIEFNTGAGPSLSTQKAPTGEGPQGSGPINPDDVDREALDAATRECNKIFDEYDVLDDIPVPGR
jgi:hypothetical protein